jgi:hypothetical protein
MVTHVQYRPSPLPTRWAGIGIVSAFIMGGTVGLVVGLDANPSTAWFAVFEVGIPSAMIGGLVGLVSGTITTGLRARRASDTTARGADQHAAVPRWPDIIVALGALTVLYALHSMDWASRVDDLGRATFKAGPTGPLAFVALTTLALSLTVLVTCRHWPRWFLVATTLATAVATVAVALSSIAAANDASHGLTRTSYEPGATVAVGAAVAITACALIGFYNAYQRHDPPRAPTDYLDEPTPQ